MAGGLMQLVAYGAQDVYLTGNPKVTFFQAVYKRHTNFAMENIEQVVNGSASNSGRLSVTVARNGDLIGNMYLELTTIQGTSGNVWTAERAVQDVELTIGGQRIDKHYRKWWRLYAELYLDDAKKAEWGKLTSSTSDASGQKCVLPLIFFFNRNPGLYLPLIALQYHEVRLDIDLASDFTSNFTTGVKVWGNYVYLDTEERRRFAQKGHEYLIEQVQHTGSDSLSASGGESQIRLSYNHPVKELVWCLSNTNATGTNGHWAFTGRPDSLTCTANAAVYSATSNAAIEPHKSGAPFLTVNAADTTGCYLDEKAAADATGAGGVAAGPLSKFKLILNGQDRFKEQDGYYFNQLQPMNHHSGNPMAGIYCYSFALKPEEHQPTGSCNFSRIDNAQVAITPKQALVNNLDMFAVNYNVLKVQSGMGGLAFSN